MCIHTYVYTHRMYTHSEPASIELLVYQTTIKISCHPFEKENKPMRKDIVLGCESVLHRWDLEGFIDIMSPEQNQEWVHICLLFLRLALSTYHYIATFSDLCNRF